MRVHPRTSSPALIASFAAVALAFTVGTAAAQVFSWRIRSAAEEITGNSSPSISYLSAMRSTLRQLQVAVDDHVTACGMGRCGPPPARAEELRGALEAAWRSYQLLPTFPGEADRWPRVEALIGGLRDTVAVAFEAVRAGRWSDAQARLHGEVNPAFDRLDGEIAQMVEADHTQGLAVAGRIDAFARTSMAVAVAVDLVALALTALAATLGIRAVRRYERSLRERADELEQFAGRVAHDVKSPLAATAIALHVARRQSTELGQAALERGERGVQRVQRLVDGLLDFARAGAVSTREAAADVQEVVDDVVGELGPVAEAQGVELRVESTPGARVACSPGVLTSIVSNLVRNAITHMGAGEPRVVRVRVPSVGAGQAVRLEVEDTGPGIPAAIGERVFEPFVRGSEDGSTGTGLGLATVKRFVDAHGGRVGFQPRAGRGTVFWLEMPPPAAPRRRPW